MSRGVNQAEGENDQDDEADDGVETISLESEADDGQRDTRDRRGNEKQQAELNETLALEVRGGEYDAGQCPDIGAAGHEGAIVHVTGVALNEIKNAARQNSGGGDKNADLQKAANDGLKTVIIHAGYTLPVMPLTIISMARARITIAKTARNVRT